MTLADHIASMFQAVTQLVSTMTPFSSECTRGSVQNLVQEDVTADLAETNISLNEIKSLLVSFLQRR